MSLIELLTCVVIIGIAAAGSMELAYVNAFWAANGMNKADNLYAARRFLDLINKDLRNTSLLTKTSSPTSTSLTLLRSADLESPQSYFDANGFPVSMSKIVYTVTPDPNATDTVTSEYIIQRQDGNASPVTVLTGLVGPSNPSSNSLVVFQFSDPNNSSIDGLSASPTSQTNSVIVNLELKRVNVGSSTSSMNEATPHSFEAIRSEIYLRNFVWGASALPLWNATP